VRCGGARWRGDRLDGDADQTTPSKPGGMSTKAIIGRARDRVNAIKPGASGAYGANATDQSKVANI